jgi:hypothetical protein
VCLQEKPADHIPTFRTNISQRSAHTYSLSLSLSLSRLVCTQALVWSAEITWMGCLEGRSGCVVACQTTTDVVDHLVSVSDRLHGSRVALGTLRYGTTAARIQGKI